MKFTLLLSDGAYPQFQTLAREAEAAGWSAIALPDSIFFPRITESDYPYADTEMIRQYISATPFIEPFVAMTWMAAVTKTLRFYPSVLKVPVRQPLILAKLLGSLAAISENRVALGAGLSPWREEFAYNGVDFDKRGKLMDACIAIIRGALTGAFFEYHSANYAIGPMKMSPAPSKPVPILIGGHSRPALVRAAKSGDGWIAANTDHATLKELVAALNALRDEYGTRRRADFEIHGMDITAETPDAYKRVRDLGVTHHINVPWAPGTTDLKTKVDAVKTFGETIISKLR